MVKKYRVIQWAIGSVGRAAVRMMLKKQSLEIVGAIVYTPEKVGRDIGELLDLDKTGVIASDNADEVLQTDADIVLIMTPASMMYKGNWDENVAQISKALKAKKNVITTVGFMYPWATHPEMSQHLDRLAKENGVTLLGTGLDSGFIFDDLVLTLTSSQARVDRITIRHCELLMSDRPHLMGYDSLLIQEEMFGIGLIPEEFEKRISRRMVNYLATIYGESAYLVADILGWKLTKVEPRLESYTAKEPLKAPFMEIKPGTICAHKLTLEWLREKETAFSLEYSVVAFPEKVKDVGEPGQSIWIDGRPACGIEFKGDLVDWGLLSTAAHAVNAIPRVVEAPPGFVCLIDLPLVTSIQ